MFGFRNPGLMRIPIAQAVAGGTSDCRNRRLQTMFQLVGYGDNAGSGLPKIYHNWAGQHWRRPVLYEMRDPEQTLMELRMVSLLPAQAVAELEAHLGTKFSSLSPIERLVLVTAATEGVVNHGRLREISTEHPTDITKMLSRLVKDGLLISAGVGRGMVYFLPWQDRQGARLFEIEDAPTLLSELGVKPPELNTLPPELSSIPPELPVLYLEWSQLSDELMLELNAIAQAVCERKRVSPELFRTTILKLCQSRYLGKRVLAQLLKRNFDDLLKRTLNPLVEENLLKTAFPSSSDPRQAYTTGSEQAVSGI